MGKKTFYIPKSPWKHYDDLIYCLGSNGGLKQFSHQKGRIKDSVQHIAEFLDTLGFVKIKKTSKRISSPIFDSFELFRTPGTTKKVTQKKTTVTYNLTEIGECYFTEKFVKSNEKTAKEILTEQLKKHPAVILVCQVLFGSSNISRQNILTLLLHHGFPVGDYDLGELNSFLVLLSHSKIARYDRNRDNFIVDWHPSTVTEPAPYIFVSPETPFTNIKHLRQILGHIKEKGFWIDKHFDKKAFDPISETLDANRLKDFIIFSSEEHCSQSAKQDYFRLKTELAKKRINIEWRLINDVFLRSFHDRWIFDSQIAYNVPPVNTIFKGQKAEFIKTENRPNITEYMSNSSPVN